MAGEQQMHWWQEEDGQTQAAQNAAARVAVTLKPLLPEPETVSVSAVTEENCESQNDTWAELEAEALRRSQETTEKAESVSFYLDESVARVRCRREMRNWTLFLGACIVGNFVNGYTHNGPILNDFQYKIALYNGFAVVFSHCFVYCPLFLCHLFNRRRWLRNVDKPVVRLSPLGIHLRLVPLTAGTSLSMFRSNVFISWGDIGWIKPKQIPATRSRYLEIYSKKAGIVNVYENDLPISAKDLAARIEYYEDTGKIV